MPKFAPQKVIPSPPFGYVDIAGLEPLMNSSAVQRLKKKRQTGLVSEVCLYATHTRLAHSVGVMGLVEQIIDQMFLRGFFEGEDRAQLKKDLRIAALLHDIGQPPFSHSGEFVMMSLGGKNHHEMANKLISGELSEIIIQCGSTPGRILNLLDKKNGDPRGKLVWSKSVGADKIGYLYQDQRVIGHNCAIPLDHTQLLTYLCFVENDVRVAETALPMLTDLQRAYFSMYTEVYFRKAALAFERVLQKALETAVNSGDISLDKLWYKSEGWVETKLEESSSELVRELYRRIDERDPLKAAVVFKMDKYVSSERVGGKQISVLGCSEGEAMKFSERYGNPVSLSSLEKKFAEKLGLKESEIVVTMPLAPQKLVPEDVSLVAKDGRLAGTLFERLPNHYQSLVESANNFYAIRVMVDPKYRQKVSESSRLLVDIVKDDSGIVLG